VTTPAQLAAQREALSRYWTHGEGSIEWRPAQLVSSAGWCAPAETTYEPFLQPHHHPAVPTPLLGDLTAATEQQRQRWDEEDAWLREQWDRTRS